MNEPGSPGEHQAGAFWPRALVILLILVGLLLTAYFGTRLLRSAAQFHRAQLRPGETDVQLIRPWMTIPYIARAYRIPENDLWQGLNIRPEGNRHKSLRILDREYAGSQPGAILDKVRSLIQAYQGQQPLTPTAPPK